jgi:hypothetical protein
MLWYGRGSELDVKLSGKFLVEFLSNRCLVHSWPLPRLAQSEWSGTSNTSYTMIGGTWTHANNLMTGGSLAYNGRESHRSLPAKARM